MKSVRLSDQQAQALDVIRRYEKIGRQGLYAHGIRIPTVYSLVRRGLVSVERIPGTSRRIYRPVPVYSCGCHVIGEDGDSHEHPTISVCPVHGVT